MPGTDSGDNRLQSLTSGSLYSNGRDRQHVHEELKELQSMVGGNIR